MNITEQSKALFLAYAKDAGNWNGMPLVGSVHVGNAREDRGNLTQLKRAGLVVTEKEPGYTWLMFTNEGIEFAAQNGIDLSKFYNSVVKMGD